MQVAIEAINELVKQAGKPRWDWQAPVDNAELTSASRCMRRPPCQAYSITDKKPASRLSEIKRDDDRARRGDAPDSRKSEVDTALSSSRATSFASAC
jgi:polyribonucleotide nucleotidyltransferase